MNESELPRIQGRLAIIAVLAVVALIATQPLSVKSQTIASMDPRFGQTLITLHQAESAGATPNEIRELVALLNKALELDGEALKLNAPDQAQRKTNFLTQVDQILTTVQTQAAALTTVASQRTRNNTILTYVGGVAAAVLGTFAYASVVSFYQKYRIKRTFEMRVTRK